jgi:transcriptional regulator with XRE-family HTH domain/tetratricopeptide (TPR) repeat protein
MVTMGRWTGRETRFLRQALRLTVRDFAEDLGVSPRTVSKWETAGRGRTPRPELQAALDTLLARATDEQHERFEHARAEGMAATTPGRDGEPQRPEHGLARPAPSTLPLRPVSGLPHMSVDQLRHVSQLVDDARSQYESDLVPYFAACIKDCQAQDGSFGPIRALPSTLSVIAALDVTARQVSLLIRRRLLTLAARSAEFTGWLYRDAGALDQATYWYDRATEWAQEAHNPAMQGYVLLRKSQLAYDHHDSIRVLTLAEAAEYGPWQLPACVRAEVAQQQALGLGMLGSPRDDVERQLDRAWSLLGQAEPADDDSQLLGAVLAEGTLRLRSAVCYTEAGQTERASDLFGQVLAGDTLSRRDAGYFTARRAAAFALGGDPDTAAALALQSVDVATNANSQRTLRVIDDVVTTLQQWSERPAVRALREVVGQ